MLNYKKFTQALKQNPQLDGKTFDKNLGTFVPGSNRGMTQDSFFLKNGSFLSRIEAELNLFTQHMGRSYKTPEYARSLICKDSLTRCEDDLIQNRKVVEGGSPVKLFPLKKPRD